LSGADFIGVIRDDASALFAEKHLSIFSKSTPLFGATSAFPPGFASFLRFDPVQYPDTPLQLLPDATAKVWVFIPGRFLVATAGLPLHFR
jgi:hypothetical protein